MEDLGLRALHRRVAGIDVHRMLHVVTVLIEQPDGSMQRQTREFGGFRRDCRALAAWLAELHVELVVMESTGIYWKSVFTHLENAGITAWVVNALSVKYPGAPRLWGWQWVFPSTVRSADPRTGVIRRHHLNEATLQKAMSVAGQRAAVDKQCSPHILRHAFATHMLQAGYDIRTVQELLGHRDVTTTMIHTDVMNRGGRGVRRPFDQI